ncbi:MAG TPA: TRAP transporter small permease [Bacteroidota bacterium]|jgi:TRAP-type C4-dicarboxylate transport system permease small subunit|nr:TRAP transporter small permease [Bacteroidota bacterium]
MKIVETLEKYLTKIESVVVVVLLSVMVLLGFIQVVLRNVFQSGIIWADIVLRHLVLWLGFVGALLATTTDRHISIDAFARFMPMRVQHGVAVVTNIFAAVVCFFLFKAALTFIGFEISDQHTVYANVPAWYAEIIIPLGYALLVIHFSLRVIFHAGSIFKGEVKH